MVNLKGRKYCSDYIPESGDIVYISCDPRIGHEQSGFRPAVTLSPQIYNKKSGLAIFVPITSHAKGYPFEVLVTGRIINGIALADQVKSLDFRIRKACFIEKIDKQQLLEIKALVKALLLSDVS